MRLSPPIYDDLRLTIPVHEALIEAGNLVTPHREDEDHHLWRVVLCGLVPADIVVCTLGDGLRGLRLAIEPEYPDELPYAVAWWERGQWVPCPSCGSALLWFEAGYVPGYRICTGRRHHHVMLSSDGGSAERVRGRSGVDHVRRS